MFGPIGGLTGLGVGVGQLALGEGFRVSGLSVRHVGIVVEGGAVPPFDLPRGPRATWGEDGRRYEIPRLVQAMPGGAEEIEMRVDTHWTDRHAYARLPEDYPGQAADAAAIARLMVDAGVAYSWASYAALAAWRFGLSTPRLEEWIGRRQDWNGPMKVPQLRPDRSGARYPGPLPSGRVIKGKIPVEAICSVLVDQAWSLAGKKVMTGVPHQCVTPGALATQLLLRTEGVRWAFPGGAGHRLTP